jgi:hypothetical protein
MAILNIRIRVEVRGQSEGFLFSILTDHIGPPNLGILIISFDTYLIIIKVYMCVTWPYCGHFPTSL